MIEREVERLVSRFEESSHLEEVINIDFACVAFTNGGSRSLDLEIPG